MQNTKLCHPFALTKGKGKRSDVNQKINEAYFATSIAKGKTRQSRFLFFFKFLNSSKSSDAKNKICHHYECITLKIKLSILMFNLIIPSCINIQKW
jgi:hypothetical protein